MKTSKIIGWGLAIGIAAASAAPASAQTKPPDSATKIKKVLLYNKIGGWVHTDGRRDVTAVMNKLAPAKGFALTVLEDDAVITLDYLKQFQVIIWDNNTNGANSIPSLVARKAVLDYVNGGGGWLLIHGAGDHSDSWADLRTALGTKFTTHGNQGQADAILDPKVKDHKELKWMVQGIAEKFRLHDEWYSFENTVRPLPNVTVVYTAGGGTTAVLKPPADGSNDFTYIWARTMGQGRLLYNAIGHGGNELMSQADSVVAKLYWQNMRYVAGDFQNGCTNKNASNYNAAARVDDGTCAGVTAVNPGRTLQGITVTHGGLRTALDFSHGGDYSVRLRDMRGAVVWERAVAAGTDEVAVGEGVKPGVYTFEARNGRNAASRRLVLH